MPAVAVISDLHFHDWSQFSKPLPNGVNNRLQHILDAVKATCHHLRSEESGDTVYVAGDIFHVRGSLKPSVLNPVVETLRELIDDGFKFRVIPGNHDLESNDSDQLTNASQVLAELGCEVATEKHLFEDHGIVMFPWVQKQAQLAEQLADQEWGGRPRPRIAIIHAPVNGVVMGIPDHGFDPGQLAAMGYDLVLSGHYHNHVDFGNGVCSIGATTHQTWGCVGSRAGAMIVHTDTCEFYQIELGAPRFIDFDANWSDDDASYECEGNYVRVKLDEATEGEIREIREKITGEFNALGCIVQAMPKNKASSRTGSTVSAGASVDQSITEWIDQNINDHKEAVQKGALDIMGELV